MRVICTVALVAVLFGCTTAQFLNNLFDRTNTGGNNGASAILSDFFRSGTGVTSGNGGTGGGSLASSIVNNLFGSGGTNTGISGGGGNTGFNNNRQYPQSYYYYDYPTGGQYGGHDHGYVILLDPW